MIDKRFDEPLDVRGLEDGNWQLLGTFDYHTDVWLSGSDKFVVHVPPGFITDFASIPRIFWNIFSPTGPYRNAAVVHDFLYRTPGKAKRSEADAVFKEAMEYLGVGWWTRHILYIGVRVGGWREYKGGL